MPTSYGMRDPLADLNARLRKLGLEPISLGGAPAVPDFASILQQPLSMPSPMETQQAITSGPMYNQLTPEAEAGVLEKVAGASMSGLGWLGTKLDSWTGARAIRGLLGGKPREMASFHYMGFNPFGYASDELGLTKPKDIVGGRDLLEQWGIVGKNQEGLDWGDVGGFITEVLLDPATYAGGFGLVMKGAKALTASGRALGKATSRAALKGAAKNPDVAARFLRGSVKATSDKLDPAQLKFMTAYEKGQVAIEEAHKVVAKIDSKLEPDAYSKAMRDLMIVKEEVAKTVKKTMLTEAQLQSRVTPTPILEAMHEAAKYKKNYGAGSETDEYLEAIHDMLGSSVDELGESASDVLRAAVKQADPKLADDLLDAEVARLMDMPIGSPLKVGVSPLFSGANADRGMRKWIFDRLPKLRERSVSPDLHSKFGRILDFRARNSDKMGKYLRWSKGGRGAARIFNPKLRGFDAHTRDVQESIIDAYDKADIDMHRAKVHGAQLRAQLETSGFADPIEIKKANPNLTDEAVKEIARERLERIELWRLGYELEGTGDTARAVLPIHDVKYADELTRMIDSNKRQLQNAKSDLAAKIADAEGKGTKAQLKKLSFINNLEKEFSNLAHALGDVQTPDGIAGAINKMRNLGKIAEDGLDIKFKTTSDLSSEVLGRVPRRLGGGLDEFIMRNAAGEEVMIGSELRRMDDWIDSAFQRAKQGGINIERLQDRYALFHPRVKQKVQRKNLTGVGGAFSRAKAARKAFRDLETEAAESGDEVAFKLKNLNPITRHQKRRKKFLTGIWGGTWTLNRWFRKYGGDSFSRAHGGDLEPAVREVLQKLGKDEHWIDAVKDEVYLQHLIDDGVIVRVPPDGKLPVWLEPEDLLDGRVRDETGQMVDAKVYVDVGHPDYPREGSRKLREISTFIATTDPGAGKNLVDAERRLFQVDPIEGVTSYYEDVMRAGVAAEVVGEVMATHGLYRLGATMKEISTQSGVDMWNFDKLLEQLDMNTNIAKRRILKRYIAHNPDEWEQITHELMRQDDATYQNLRTWLDPDQQLELKIGDYVIAKSRDEMWVMLGIRTLKEEQDYLKMHKMSSLEEVTIEHIEHVTGTGTPARVVSPDAPAPSAAGEVAEEVAEEVIEEVIEAPTPVTQAVAGDAVEEVIEEAPVETVPTPTRDIDLELQEAADPYLTEAEDIEAALSRTITPDMGYMKVSITPTVAKIIVENPDDFSHVSVGQAINALRETTKSGATPRLGTLLFEVSMGDAAKLIERIKSKEFVDTYHRNAVNNARKTTLPDLEKAVKAWDEGFHDLFRVEGATEIPETWGIQVPVGVSNQILDGIPIDEMPSSLREKFEGNLSRKMLTFTDEEKLFLETHPFIVNHKRGAVTNLINDILEEERMRTIVPTATGERLGVISVNLDKTIADVINLGNLELSHAGLGERLKLRYSNIYRKGVDLKGRPLDKHPMAQRGPGLQADKYGTEVPISERELRRRRLHDAREAADAQEVAEGYIPEYRRETGAGPANTSFDLNYPETLAFQQELKRMVLEDDLPKPLIKQVRTLTDRIDNLVKDHLSETNRGLLTGGTPKVKGKRLDAHLSQYDPRPRPGTLIVKVGSKEIDVNEAYRLAESVEAKSLSGPQLEYLRGFYDPTMTRDSSAFKTMIEKAYIEKPAIIVKGANRSVVVHGQHRIERAIAEGKPLDVKVVDVEKLSDKTIAKDPRVGRAYVPPEKRTSWRDAAFDRESARLSLPKQFTTGRFDRTALTADEIIERARDEAAVRQAEDAAFDREASQWNRKETAAGPPPSVAPAVPAQAAAAGPPPSVAASPDAIAPLINKIDRTKKFHLFIPTDSGLAYGGSFRWKQEALAAWGDKFNIPKPKTRMLENRAYKGKVYILDTKQIDEMYPVAREAVEEGPTQAVPTQAAPAVPTQAAPAVPAPVDIPVVEGPDWFKDFMTGRNLLPEEGMPSEAVATLTGGNKVPLRELSHANTVPNSILNDETISKRIFENIVIDPMVGKDIKMYMNSFTKTDVRHELWAAGEHFTDLFKQYATSLWPAFHFRNVMSAWMNGVYSGVYDPNKAGPMAWIQPYIDAWNLRSGKAVEGLAHTPTYAGKVADDIEATQDLINNSGGQGVVGADIHFGDLEAPIGDDKVGNFLRQRGEITPVMTRAEDVVNPNVGRIRSFKDAVKLEDDAIGGKWWQGRHIRRGLERVRRFGLQAGNEAEYWLRMAGVIAHVKRGLSVTDAIVKVKLAQVDYRALTPIERNLFRRIIPFYSFTRRQIPFVMEELTDVRSPMAMMTRGLAAGEREQDDPNHPIPDYLSSGFNVPLHRLGMGGGEEGMARYATGTGGMMGGIEDVYGLIRPGDGAIDTVKKTGSAFGARMNPALTFLPQLIADYSLFHQRPRSEVKSETARLIGQLQGSDKIPSYPTPQIDAVLGLVPGYARGVSTARSLTDWPRRPMNSVANTLARVLPAVTGARITDVDVARGRNKLIQERLEEMLARNPNVSKFSKMYVPENKLHMLTPEELEFYLLYKKLGSEASRASYARRKAAEYSN